MDKLAENTGFRAGSIIFTVCILLLLSALNNRPAGNGYHRESTETLAHDLNRHSAIPVALSNSLNSVHLVSLTEAELLQSRSLEKYGTQQGERLGRVLYRHYHDEYMRLKPKIFVLVRFPLFVRSKNDDFHLFT